MRYSQKHINRIKHPAITTSARRGRCCSATLLRLVKHWTGFCCFYHDAVFALLSSNMSWFFEDDYAVLHNVVSFVLCCFRFRPHMITTMAMQWPTPLWKLPPMPKHSYSWTSEVSFYVDSWITFSQTNIVIILISNVNAWLVFFIGTASSWFSGFIYQEK